MDEGKILKFTELSDPQHHGNEMYGGRDHAALNFIRQRETAMEKARVIEKQMEPKHTDAHITEAEVSPDVIESNKHYESGALKREMVNSYYNHPMVLADFEEGRAISLPPGHSRGPALIIGSGPSLDKAHDLIRGWKGGLFCSTSQCVTMAGLDKKNFFILNVDVKTETGEYMPLWLWEDRNCFSVTHPCVDPATIQCWNWKKLYFRIMVQQMKFYSEVLPLAYPMIKTQLYVYGCNASALISCAALMGYNPLFLVGCDFSYPGNQDRFRALVPEKKDGIVTWSQ